MATCQRCRKQVPDTMQGAHCPHCGTPLPVQPTAPKKTVFGYAPAPPDGMQPPAPKEPPFASPPPPAAAPPSVPAEGLPAAAALPTTPASPAAPPDKVDPMGATQYVSPEDAKIAPPPGAPPPDAWSQTPAPPGAPPPGAPPPGAPPSGAPAGAWSQTPAAAAAVPQTVSPMAPMASPAAVQAPAPTATASPSVGVVQQVSVHGSAGRAPVGLYLGTILGGMLLAGGLTALAVANLSHMHELLYFCWMPSIVSGVFFCVLLYKAWGAIQDGQTPVSPGKAVGFLFIPFFNFYWIFVAIGSWGREYNAFAQRNQRSLPAMESNLFFAYPIVAICAVVPLVNFLAAPALLVLMVIIVLKLCEGINAIADASS